MENLAGRSFGPYLIVPTTDRIAEFTLATGDDLDRWGAVAPPGFAAVVLFAAAPAFLADPDVAPYAASVVHTDQAFAWSGPFRAGAEIEVDAAVASVRQRGDLFRVVFEVAARTGGATLLQSSSRFLMSDGPAAAPGAEEPELPPGVRGPAAIPRPGPMPASGEAIPPLAKSVSRADLVRYAAASGDWNPIHWDHDSAVAAGLPGIVAHGLLMAAWLAQAAGRFEPRPDPLAAMEIRFRRPLRPGVAAEVGGEVVSRDGNAARMRLALSADGHELVTAQATARTG